MVLWATKTFFSINTVIYQSSEKNGLDKGTFTVAYQKLKNLEFKESLEV